MRQISERSEHSGGKPEDLIDPRYVVVFVKDGDVLGSCKSFKMNIQEEQGDIGRLCPSTQ